MIIHLRILTGLHYITRYSFRRVWFRHKIRFRFRARMRFSFRIRIRVRSRIGYSSGSDYLGWWSFRVLSFVKEVLLRDLTPDWMVLRDLLSDR